jgi:haloalkane dehalogenase
MSAERAVIRRGYVRAGRAQLHYRRVGVEGAPLLVLLHQTPSHSAMFEPLMSALSDRFDLLAFDTPGFGQSDALSGAFSIAAAASALSAAVRWLHAGPRFWFGHHTGAALALQVASTHPEQVARLALSGPCLLDDALRQRLPILSAPVSMTADGSHLTTLWQRMRAKDADAAPAVLQRETLEAAAAGPRYAEAYRAVLEVDTAAQLRALRCPALVFAGTEDPLYPQLDPAFRLLANGRKAEIAGARTFVCERQTTEVARLLADFFGEPHG